jgi:hypothetical protein
MSSPSAVGRNPRIGRSAEFMTLRGRKGRDTRRQASCGAPPRPEARCVAEAVSGRPAGAGFRRIAPDFRGGL